MNKDKEEENKKKLMTENNYLKEQNSCLLSKIEFLEKQINTDSEEFQVKIEYHNLVSKNIELQENLLESEKNNSLLKKSIEMIKNLLEQGNTLNNSINTIGGVAEYFKLCNFILIENLDKKDELRNENIELVEKLVFLSEKYSSIINNE